MDGAYPGLSLRAGSRPKQQATDQPLAGYFRLILLLILVKIRKRDIHLKRLSQNEVPF